MKNQIALLLLVLLCTPLIAQDAAEEKPSPWKERMFLSLSVAPGISGAEGKVRMVYFTTTPKLGYFITNRFAAGVHARYSGQFMSGEDFHSIAAGPFARYYVINGERWGAFGEAGYFYGRAFSPHTATPTNISNIYGGLGVEYRFNTRLSLGVMVNMERSLINDNKQHIVPRLGLKWRF